MFLNGREVECNDDMTETELERYWSSVKGRAIARECNKFYSQCLAQCWVGVGAILEREISNII